MANSIIVHTRRRKEIKNVQDSVMSELFKKGFPDLLRKYPDIIAIRTGPIPIYNCFGMVFAARRTAILDQIDIANILIDDEYEEIIDLNKVLPGDLILYYEGSNNIMHAGLVISKPCASNFWIPDVVSKWNVYGEVLHSATYGPYAEYERKYYRVVK